MRSGFNLVCGSGSGFGSRKTKMTRKKRKSEEINVGIEELDVLFGG